MIDPRYKWEIDREALDRAVAELGLTLPVRLVDYTEFNDRDGADLTEAVMMLRVAAPEEAKDLPDKSLLDLYVKDTSGLRGGSRPTFDLETGDMIENLIYVNSMQGISNANKTLWHELSHVVDADAQGNIGAWALARERERNIEYVDQPGETRARQFARDHRGQMLVRAREESEEVAA